MKFKLQMTKYVTTGGWLGVGSIAKIYDVIVYFRIKVAGGTSILHKTIQAFLPPSVGTVLMVDLHGYDGFPALMALEASGLQLKQFQKRTAEPPTTRCLPHDRTFGQEKKIFPLHFSHMLFPSWISMFSGMCRGQPLPMRNHLPRCITGEH